MKPFNFFKGYVYSDEYTIPPTINQLLAYNDRLKNAYIFNLDISEGNDEYTALTFINQISIEFIEGGQLTSYSEIRSYYHVSFENMAVNIYGTVITDIEHEILTREEFTVMRG